MKKYIIYGIISVFTILQGLVNTETMRSEDNSDGFKNKVNLDLGYEKENSEVLDLEDHIPHPDHTLDNPTDDLLIKTPLHLSLISLFFRIPGIPGIRRNKEIKEGHSSSWGMIASKSSLYRESRYRESLPKETKTR